MSALEPLPGLPAAPERTDPVAAIRAAIAEAPETIAALQEAGELGRLAHLTDAFRAIKRDLTEAERTAEAAVVSLMTERRVEIDGLTLERRRSTDRKLWQSDELLRLIVRRIVKDPDAEWGHPDDLADAIVAEVEAVMPVTGSLGWRVTALRERGIDPDEWAESKPGRTSVQIASGGVS